MLGNRLISGASGGLAAPNVHQLGSFSAGISSPWEKKKCSPFIFLPLIMNKLLSSPLGTKEQNSKEECRRHFLWMSATDPERKETQSRQVRVWLSAWSIKSVSPGAVRHPLGPKIHHLRKGETAGAWLGELVQKGPGRRSGRSGSGHGRCLSPWPGTAALHGRFPRT